MDHTVWVYIYGIDEDSTFELGWGFYLIILPLIVTILMELVVRTSIIKIQVWLIELKGKTDRQDGKLKKIVRWISKF